MTLKERSSIRITVSDPGTLLRVMEPMGCEPNALVTVTLTFDVPFPAPRPHPPVIAAVSTTAITANGICLRPGTAS